MPAKAGLFFLLNEMQQCPCRGGPHGIIRIVERVLQEGKKLTIPHMPEGSKGYNFWTGKRIRRQAG
jgi:hypothetical protein